MTEIDIHEVVTYISKYSTCILCGEDKELTCTRNSSVGLIDLCTDCNTYCIDMTIAIAKHLERLN